MRLKPKTSPLPMDPTAAFAPSSKIERGTFGWLLPKGLFVTMESLFPILPVKSARSVFFSVLEDKKGNFWFATIGSGVYYYDGKSFQNYTTKDGLASDRVGNIYEIKS